MRLNNHQNCGLVAYDVSRRDMSSLQDRCGNDTTGMIDTVFAKRYLNTLHHTIIDSATYPCNTIDWSQALVMQGRVSGYCSWACPDIADGEEYYLDGTNLVKRRKK